MPFGVPADVGNQPFSLPNDLPHQAEHVRQVMAAYEEVATSSAPRKSTPDVPAS